MRLSPFQVFVVTSFAIIPRVRSFLISPQRVAVPNLVQSTESLGRCGKPFRYPSSTLHRSISDSNFVHVSKHVWPRNSYCSRLFHDAVTRARRKPAIHGAPSFRAVAASDFLKGQSFIVGDADSGWGASVGLDEDALLPEHPGLVAGALPNGLRYSILQNKIPANRMYANLEIHAGSVDEQDNEQAFLILSRNSFHPCLCIAPPSICVGRRFIASQDEPPGRVPSMSLLFYAKDPPPL
jgi:hypothetical protein